MAEAVGDSTVIAAPARRVYAMVSDVTRMPEWSPEQAAARWIGGATGPTLGARFRGSNRNGRRRWTTTCTITAAEPGSRFASRVSSYGLPVAEWSYDLAETDSGCVVTESTVDRRGWLIRYGGGVVTGVWHRRAHNLEGIRRTLAALKAAAESADRS